MKKKKKKTYGSFAELGDLVYSTDRRKMEAVENPPPEEQTLEAHFSKKGRGGKTVTVIKGFRGSDDALKQLAKKIKSRLGTGGSVKDGEIIIQGNNREQVVEILRAEGFRVKKVGG